MLRWTYNFKLALEPKKLQWKFGAKWALIWRLLAQKYLLNGSELVCLEGADSDAVWRLGFTTFVERMKHANPVAGLFSLVTPERQEPTPKWADYYIDELIQKGSNVLPIDVLSPPINTLDRSGLMSGHIVCLKSR